MLTLNQLAYLDPRSPPAGQHEAVAYGRVQVGRSVEVHPSDIQGDAIPVFSISSPDAPAPGK